MRLSFVATVILTPLLALNACLGGEAPESDTPPPADSAHVEAMLGGAAPTDTVHVRLLSFAFEMDRDTFVAGRPYVFVLENAADIAHEWAVVPHGAEDEETVLLEVEADELPPGAAHTVTFTFPEAGRFDFACFVEEPTDHYEAGMVHPVTVVAE